MPYGALNIQSASEATHTASFVAWVMTLKLTYLLQLPPDGDDEPPLPDPPDEEPSDDPPDEDPPLEPPPSRADPETGLPAVPCPGPAWMLPP